MLLAGVVMKLGAYGCLRVAMPLSPEAFVLLQPAFAWLAIIWMPFRREMAGRGITAVMDHHAGRFFLKTTLAAGLAAAAIAAVLAAVPGDDMGLRLLRLGVGAAAGLGIYSVTLLGLGVPEAAAAARLLGGRLGVGRWFA